MVPVKSSKGENMVQMPAKHVAGNGMLDDQGKSIKQRSVGWKSFGETDNGLAGNFVLGFQ